MLQVEEVLLQRVRAILESDDRVQLQALLWAGWQTWPDPSSPSLARCPFQQHISRVHVSQDVCLSNLLSYSHLIQYVSCTINAILMTR